MNNLSPMTKIAIGVIALLAAIFVFSEDAQQSFRQSYDESYNQARGNWNQQPGRQMQCPQGTLPAAGPGGQGGCVPVRGQYPAPGPRRRPSNYEDSRYRNPDPQYYPPDEYRQNDGSYGPGDGGYTDSGEVDLGPQTEADEGW